MPMLPGSGVSPQLYIFLPFLGRGFRGWAYLSSILQLCSYFLSRNLKFSIGKTDERLSIALSSNGNQAIDSISRIVHAGKY
jgi:hypothetical protein